MDNIAKFGLWLIAFALVTNIAYMLSPEYGIRFVAAVILVNIIKSMYDDIVNW